MFKPSFLIAEDQSIVRMGTSLLIKDLYPQAFIAEADNFDETIKILQTNHFDLLILDIRMPGGDNLHMVEAVKLRRPDIAILVFTNYDEHIYGPKFLQAGVKGYLSKMADTDTIKSAITRILNGEKYMSLQVKEDLSDNKANPPLHYGHSTLSDREIEVMQLLIRGKSSTQIKEMLNIHSSTVSTYKARIFEKMQVCNVIELIEKVSLLNETTG